MKIKISFQCLFVMWMAVVVEYMDSSLVHNIFMLCAMWFLGRLFTGGRSGSQNDNHTFVYLRGGWVFQPPQFRHLCCGSIRRALPLEVRTVYPDANEHPAGMCGECHLCHRPNCLV